MEAHLDHWVREAAEVRVHGTTGEAPRRRFERDEASRLKPITGIPAFLTGRDLVRQVWSDCAVEVDGNAYSVPWRLIGERVGVTMTGTELRVSPGNACYGSTPFKKSGSLASLASMPTFGACFNPSRVSKSVLS